jgi:hypothetical protein
MKKKITNFYAIINFPGNIVTKLRHKHKLCGIGNLWNQNWTSDGILEMARTETMPETTAYSSSLPSETVEEIDFGRSGESPTLSDMCEIFPSDLSEELLMG